MNDKLEKIKAIMGDEAEDVTVMYNLPGANNGSNYESEGDEGALASEILTVLKDNPVAASIIKKMYDFDVIKTNKLAEELLPLMFLKGMEDDEDE